MEINPATQAYLFHIQEINPTYTNRNVDLDSKMDFSKLLKGELNKVNGLQIQANRENQELVTGEAESLHSVLLATEEARLALEMAVQVRNKLIESYKEINNLQL